MGLAHLLCMLIYIVRKSQSKRSVHGSIIKMVCKVARIATYITALVNLWVSLVTYDKEASQSEPCEGLNDNLLQVWQYRSLEVILFQSQVISLCLNLLLCKFLIVFRNWVQPLRM